MEQFDDRVDLYINKAPEYARPLLEYIREIVHEASPLIKETIKWSVPFFDFKGPVCHMVAFKQHCAFGFWKTSLLNDPNKALLKTEDSRGSFGRLTGVSDLPAKEIIIDLILQAIALNENDQKVPAKNKEIKKGSLVVPGYFTDFLAQHPKALEVFHDFSYSHKKEYVEWITDAKTDATRQKRMETAAEWIVEGKSRNWKYQ